MEAKWDFFYDSVPRFMSLVFFAAPYHNSKPYSNLTLSSALTLNSTLTLKPTPKQKVKNPKHDAVTLMLCRFTIKRHRFGYALVKEYQKGRKLESGRNHRGSPLAQGAMYFVKIFFFTFVKIFERKRSNNKSQKHFEKSKKKF